MKKKRYTSIIENLSTYELCRWAALKEAIDIIGEKCDEKNIDFDKFNNLKPNDIFNYVDIMSDNYFNQMCEEEARA